MSNSKLSSRLNQLGKELFTPNIRIGATYAVGDFLVMGIRFALAILYAFYLSPKDYGILAVVIAISTLMGVLISLGLKGAAFKQSFDYSDATDQRRFYGTIWIFLIGFAGLVTIVLDQFFLRVNLVLFENIPYVPFIQSALWIGFFNIFGTILYEIFRAKEKPGWYVAVAFSNSATLVVLVFVFASLLGAGLNGVVLAMLITGLIWAVVFSLAMVPYVVLALDITKLRKALVFSVPLLPHFLSHWVLNLSDRLILERSVTLSDLGIYSLAYNFGNVQQVLTNSGNSALMPRYASAKSDDQDNDQTSDLFRHYIQLMGAFTVAISLFSDLVLRIAAPTQYREAGGIIPWIALGFLFLAMYYGPMNTITLTAGRSQHIWLLTLAAGTYNVVANLIFVPLFGIIAAAINTTIGYGLLFFFTYSYSLRVKRVSYDWPGIAKTIAAVVVCVAVGRMINTPSNVGALIKDVAIFLAFVIFIFGSQLRAAWRQVDMTS